MGEDERNLETTVKRLRKDISAVEVSSRRAEDRSLKARWRTALSMYKQSEEKAIGNAEYPRMGRLFDIVRGDGKVRLMLSYDEYNPDPDFRNLGERKQVEALLKFEEPLMQLVMEAGNKWRSGDFEGEAALLEEYAVSNPQKDTILDLASEARREALSGASSQSRQKRR
jgi:hypothetical protein